MSLLETYAEIMAAEIAKEIDNEILDELIAMTLKDEGWTATSIGEASNAEMTAWIHTNAKGDYKMISSCWWFELEVDAVMFLLRWS